VLRIKNSLTLVVMAALATKAAAQTVESSAGTVIPARTAILSPSIAAGELVRVYATRARLDGAMAEFVRIDSNLVIAGQPLAPDAPPRQWSVPIDAIQRLEVLRGRERSKGRIFTGVVVGALVGAGIGAVMTPFLECGGACDKEGERTPFASRKLGAFIGAPIGGLLGGVVGGMSRKRWNAVTVTIR
jgi:hypothetical protein